ncbi:MAG TPA: fibronectin type III domain-containing protein [Flavobacteriales bacterium]|nr:fibronectin type III domain-containing protein [Flavobacteriales bacterium]
MRIPLLTTAALCCTSLWAQTQLPDSAAIAREDSIYRAERGKYYAHIEVRAFYDGNAVRLRWAPDAPGGWLNANGIGYVVERVDLGSPGDTAQHESAAFTTLTTEPLLPLDIPGWRDLSIKHPDDQYVKVAGEMIHAARQASNVGFDKDIQGASARLQERYGFALLSADLSWPAAEGSALAWTDRTVQPGRQYLYRVRTAKENASYPIGDGAVVVGTAAVETIKRPLISGVNVQDSLVMISWPREAHEAWFSAYNVERSGDGGKSWTQVNKRPFVSFTNPELPATRDVIVYTDTIDARKQPYSYRIIGLTAFGTRSEASQPVQAAWRDRTPPPSPTNVRATEKKGTIEITWDYPAGVKDLKGFHVTRGSSTTGDERTLTDKLLPPTARSFTDRNPERLKHNFYLVIAVDTANNPGLSMSAMGSLTDSIPPARPTGLEGKVDTNGVVTLTWRLGKEDDLYGYHVFWSNQRDHVMSRLTGTAIRDTVFTDTVNMRTLTKTVYYEVMAVDLNRNGSKLSATLELKRPDLRPPTAPVFKDYRVSDAGIYLRWAPSSSDDVVRHCLLRRAVGTTAWDTLVRIPVKEQRFDYMDKDGGKPAYYEYAVVAFDDGGWHTFSQQTLHLRMNSKEKLARVEKLTAKAVADKKLVQLEWDYAPREGVKFILYRQVNGGPWQQVKLLPGDARTYSDRLLKSGQEGTYFIQAVTDKGRDSDYSPKVKARL